MRFPDNFLWAASTSAYQFEGATDIDGKGPSIQDMKQRLGDIENAMDHYHRYRDDIKLLRELGLKAYRFSISWSRILPKGRGEINEKGLTFYKNLITECVKNNIVPVITMYHDDLPYELYKQGGWENRLVIDAFVEYVTILLNNFKDTTIYWQPIGEQNLLTIEKIVEQKDSLKSIFQQNHHMFLAQAKTVKLFHDMNCKGNIGPVPNIVAVYPYTSNPEHIMAANDMETLRNWLYLDVSMVGEYSRRSLRLLEKLDARPHFEKEDKEILKKGTCDYIAFSNYTSICVTTNDDNSIIDKTGMKYGFNLPGLFKIIENEHLGYTAFDQEVDPIGTRIILNQVYERYRKPIFIVERGLGKMEELNESNQVEDTDRIEYLKLQILELKKAIDDGVDIIGYCTWSGFDVMSTGNGISKRYGLIYIDRENDDCREMRRIPKRSYYWYKNVIENNGRQLD